MLMRRLLFWLQGQLPTRHISHLGKPYLERSYLGTICGVRFYLHRFVACDEEGVHDHPFLYSMSLILAGWYFEDRWARRVTRHWFNFIGPNTFHRVVLPEHATHDVWTVFAHTRRRKPWGVLRAVARGLHGPLWQYTPKSLPTDPAFSTWHLTAPTGKALRAQPSLNIDGCAAFNIPLGLNAYAVGLAQYPDSARQHAQQVDQKLLPQSAAAELAESSSQMG
ncbi:hypothetical protein [Burkholderia cenocepacia]|uniref:hypothetical protein n=1 Tax=Burkholderia cenocepacia TaxID=95486 RepID=UPI000761B93B|nr:hypothetical protein [Burkholderia cenocepacia]KWU23350.1 hypothetical protein AS149_37395 [Burkholderia cenocepacia]